MFKHKEFNFMFSRCLLKYRIPIVHRENKPLNHFLRPVVRKVDSAIHWLRLPLSNFKKYKTMDTTKTVNILIRRFD